MGRRKNILDDKSFFLQFYEENKGYKNDLVYAYYVCNSIINAILNQNIKNEYLKMEKAV